MWAVRTLGTDVSGNKKVRRYATRGTQLDMRVPDFVRTSRATLLPVINAAGDTGPPLFVLKEAALPYRKVLIKGKVQLETYGSHLPRGAVVAMRCEQGGVDSMHKYCDVVRWTQT